MSQSCYLHLALYSRTLSGVDDHSAFHWAFVVTRGKTIDLNRKTAAYQIVDNSGTWATAHKAEADLLKSQRLLCLITLPQATMSEEDMHNFLQDPEVNPSHQTDTPVLLTRQRWTCAQWCIRALETLEQSGFIALRGEMETLEARSMFYSYILRLVKGRGKFMNRHAPSIGPPIIVYEDHRLYSDPDY